MIAKVYLTDFKYESYNKECEYTFVEITGVKKVINKINKSFKELNYYTAKPINYTPEKIDKYLEKEFVKINGVELVNKKKITKV